jgi:hypothetical protein
MPAIAAGVIFVLCWLYAATNQNVHTPKDKPAIVKEVK